MKKHNQKPQGVSALWGFCFFGKTVKAVLPTLVPLFLVLIAVTYLPFLVLAIPQFFGLI